MLLVLKPLISKNWTCTRIRGLSFYYVYIRFVLEFISMTSDLPHRGKSRFYSSKNNSETDRRTRGRGSVEGTCEKVI